MEIVNIVEKEGFVEIHVKGANHTILNLIQEYAWENGIEFAYRKDHPLLDDFHIKIISDNPKEDMRKLLEIIKKDLENGRKQVDKLEK